MSRRRSAYESEDRSPLLLVRFDEPIQFEVTGSYRGPFESLALARRYDFTWWAAHELWTVGVNAYDPATLHSGAAPLPRRWRPGPSRAATHGLSEPSERTVAAR